MFRSVTLSMFCSVTLFDVLFCNLVSILFFDVVNVLFYDLVNVLFCDLVNERSWRTWSRMCLLATDKLSSGLSSSVVDLSSQFLLYSLPPLCLC